MAPLSKEELQVLLKQIASDLEGAQLDLDAARTRHDDLLEQQRSVQASLEELG